MTNEHENAVDEGTMAHHLEHLAVTAEDVVAFLTRPHDEGEIHPEALPKAEHLALGLREVIDAIRHHDHLEHLAVSSDDVWKMLTVKHKDHTDGTIT